MSTVMPGYSEMPPFHDFTNHTSSHGLPSHLQNQQMNGVHPDPFGMIPVAGPSSHAIQYQSLPTASYPSSHQPPPFTHSNSAPEIPLYQTPSVLTPVDNANQPGIFTGTSNSGGYPIVNGQMPTANFVPNYHFGGLPPGLNGPTMAVPNGYSLGSQGFTSGHLAPPEGDWDDDDAREMDMVYGNLEVCNVSPSFPSVPSPAKSKIKKSASSSSVKSSRPSSLVDPSDLVLNCSQSTPVTPQNPSPSSSPTFSQDPCITPLPSSPSISNGSSPSKPFSPLSPISEHGQTLFPIHQAFKRSRKKQAHEQVKHRRRTTPEQLKVLEHWFSVNPKPDNSLREWLAIELGMTKRNVQVWFQNRRAKVKGLAIKERDRQVGDIRTGSESDQSVPPSATSLTTTIVTPEKPGPSGPSLLPPAIMGRRVSIANGEAAHISLFIQKRQSGKPVYSPGRAAIGQIGAARRGSIPYPSPVHGQTYGSPNPLSPRASPVVRPMPSQLHLAAMRNNTRRASMPGAAQLISSGPFTPPRNVSGQSGQNNIPVGRVTRELSPIKDHCEDPNRAVFSETDFSTTYLTPPSSTYFGAGLTLPTDSTGQFSSPMEGMPFTPFDAPISAGPLPNPSFQFGQQSLAGAVGSANGTITEDQIYLLMQQRGRLGSIGSIGTFTTENGTDGSEWSGGDWLGGPDDFDPSSRRSSGPPELLDNLGLMGFTQLPSTSGQPLRPSPLGQTFQTQSASGDQIIQSADGSLAQNIPSSYGMAPSFTFPLTQPSQIQLQGISPNAMQLFPQNSMETSPEMITGPQSISNSNAASRNPSTGPSPGATGAQPVLGSMLPPPNPALSNQSQMLTMPFNQVSQSVTMSPLPIEPQSMDSVPTVSLSRSQPQPWSSLQMNGIPQASQPVRSVSDNSNANSNAPFISNSVNSQQSSNVPSLGYSTFTDSSGDSLFTNMQGISLGSNNNSSGDISRSASGSNLASLSIQDNAVKPFGQQQQSPMKTQKVSIGVGSGIGVGVGVGGNKLTPTKPTTTMSDGIISTNPSLSSTLSHSSTAPLDASTNGIAKYDEDDSKDFDFCSNGLKVEAGTRD